MATLNPIITGTPGEPPSYNVGMAETFSWIPIENNANRPLFARAGYITNLSDLSISLSASDINIGSVELADGVNPSIRATIVALGGSEGSALKVLSQDLESSIDDVTIGDKTGSFAAVNKSLSALRVFEVAPVTAVSILNTVPISGSVSISNPVTSLNISNTIGVSGSVSITNPVTQLSATILNPSFTVLNPVSSVSITNQLSAFSMVNPVTALNINNTVAISGSLTVANPVTAVSVTNQLTGITVTNPISSVTVTNPVTAVSILNTVPISGSVTLTNPVTAVEILNTVAVSGSLTVLNPVSSFSLTNQLTSITVTNPTSAVYILNTAAISGSVTVINPISSVSLTNQISAFTILNPVTSVDILNTVAVSGSVTILNPVSSVSLTNQISSFSITNPVTAVDVSGSVTVLNPVSSINVLNALSATILNPVTSLDISNTVAVSGSITITNPISSVSITNPVTSLEVTNTVAVSGNITITNPTTAVYILNTTAVSGSLTVLNSISSVSITNQLTGITILNPTTAVNVSNTVGVSGSITVTNPTTGVQVLNSIALRDLNDNNVTVTPATSSLNVNVTNSIVATVDTATGFPVSFADNATVDAFQRLRISAPVTLFDSKQLHQMSTLFWSNTSQSGSIYHTGDSDPSITLTTNANNGYAIRQTTQRFNYQSGKSMLYMFTGTLNPEENITKRYGCFSSLTTAPFTPNVGLYFEASNDTIHCVQHNTGFLVPSVSASRTEWNIDKLDGTGPSGQTITLSGTNIFVIDYEWLGVGRVRYGVVLDGQVWYCHKIDNTGKAGAYLRSPNHPIRAELRQTGTGSGSMKMICSTVISEGGSDFSGVTRSIDTVSNTVGSGVRRAILGVRLQYNKLDSVNQIINAGVICMQQASSNQAPYKYEIVLNPAGVTGGTWTDITESNFQRWRGNVTPTSDTGFVLATGFGSAGAGIDLGTFNLKKFLRIGSTVHGVRDELYLVVTPLAANDGVYGSLSFIESD